MAGKNNRLGSGEISNMFDISHGPNRPQPTLTGRLGLSIFLKPTLLIGSLSRVVEHPHKTSVENTIPPLLNAYHVTRSGSRDKHKLEVMTSEEAFFFPSSFFSSTYTPCYSTK